MKRLMVFQLVDGTDGLPAVRWTRPNSEGVAGLEEDLWAVLSAVQDAGYEVEVRGLAERDGTFDIYRVA